MKKFIKENRFKIITVLFLLSLGIGLFYWFHYRPSRIISQCSFEAKDSAIKRLNNNKKYKADDRDTYYKWCLQENGL